MKTPVLFNLVFLGILTLVSISLNAQVSLTEPSFTTKNISLTTANVLLDGTKLPSTAGFTIAGSPVNNSIVSLTGGQVKFVSTSGVSDQYIMTLTDLTTPIFKPTGNFTIEFKGKVLTSSGRGLDMVIRDGKSTSRTIAFHKDKVFLNSHVNPMHSLDATQEHIYTIAVDKESTGASKYYFYVDGVYVWGDETASATNSTNIFSFTFGKANANQNLEAYISYLAVDQTGAYKPVVQTTPVDLVSYTAQKAANAIKLSWQTASETNNSHFEIERSLNGIDFAKIGEVKGKGASKYFYDDIFPIKGTSYYRLVQYDLDGARTELGIKTAKYSLSSQVIVYPNPIKPGATLYVESSRKNSILKLIDLTGRVLFEGKPQTVGESLLSINLPMNLNRGLYFLSEINGDTVRSKIFVN